MSPRPPDPAFPRPVTLAAALAAVVFAGGAAAGKLDTQPAPSYDPTVLITSDQAQSRTSGAGPVAQLRQASGSEAGIAIPGLYIVQLREPPVAMYRGGQSGFDPIPRLSGRDRLDVRSTEAARYADHLESRQQALLSDLNQRFSAQIAPLKDYQFAFNGIAVALNDSQLEYVANHSQVRMVEPVALLPLDTDVGPQFINAPDIWNGIATDGAPGSKGEGIVIGVIDSGVNWQSPSFADIAGDGYDHSSPLGPENFLGVCATVPADPDIGPNCNDKLIGAYANSFEFVQQVNFECANPDDPDNELGLSPAICAQIAVPLLDYDNALDENGHGSHTASTAGGNEVDIDFLGSAQSISGVAPRANLIAYDTCHTNSNGQGSCFNIATLAAIEQTVEDGIVDVINYSIGGGAQPWNEANSQAFLAAVDAGIFVSASAGNSGPGPATLGHLEPWVATVAASTHTRGAFSYQYSAAGAVTPPPEVIEQPLLLGSVGGPHDSAIEDEPVVISPLIDAANDGCDPYAPATFDDAVAVIRRGTCAFSIKAENAEDAGAIAVIIANNAAGDIAPGIAPAVPFPVFGITQVRGDALRDYVNDPGNLDAATITIPLGATAPAVQGDVMAGFSSRGPGAFDALKPDVTGPGVNILAAYVGDPTSAEGASDPDGYGTISGTSMSSPHNAGAAALIRAVRPEWSVAEVKSALMMTSKRTGILKEDGATTADPFDRGAGRIDLAFAAESGLVMNETPLQMFFADPAEGGDPATLNIPSLQNRDCVGTCSWTRRLRSVATTTETYDVSFATTSDVEVTVTPSSFTISPGGVVDLIIEADTSAAAAGQFHFGDIVLQPQLSSDTFIEAATPLDPVDIPDGLYAGGFNDPATQACLAIDTTGDVSGAVAGATVEVAADHTWVGDLVMKLGSPDGSVLGLLSCPGANETTDDGTTCGFARPGNLVSTSPIIFDDNAMVSAEALGDGLTTELAACADDEICEYVPAPGAISQPPASFGELVGETAEGVWTLCAGDVNEFDEGSITSFELTLQYGEQTVPTLHMPVAVFAVDPVAEISLAPEGVAATAIAGGAVETDTLTIGNAGTIDLDWSWNSSGQVPAGILYSQLATIADNPGSGFSTGFYSGNGGNGVFLADSFTLAADNNIGYVHADGFVFAPAPADAYQDVTFHIFPDADGAPDGDPQTTPENAVWSYTASIGDPGLSILEGPYGQGIRLDLVAASESLSLPAGKYWFIVAPIVGATGAPNTDEWFWAGTGPTLNQDDVALLIDPGNLFNAGFTSWTALEPLLMPPNNVRFRGMSFEVGGAEQCGAPWLTVNPTSGILAPGTTEDVEVAFDPTDLTPGTYTALVCIDSNDPATPTAVAEATFTVLSAEAQIFADGFEEAAP